MAPTIGSSSVGSRSPSVHRRQPGGSIERSGLVCRVKYTNTLPDIPFESKSIKYPFSRKRFLQYKPTTLEKLCKVELHTDFDLGVNIDLINPETYIRPPGSELHPDDNALLQDDDNKKSDTKRSGLHKKQYTFFRPSEYISQDFKQYGVSKERAESRIDVKEKFKDDEIYKDRAAQIEAIEKTFEDALKPIKEHYAKKDVYATEVLPLLPDFEMWQHACAQVIFDTDPAPRGSKSTQTKSHDIMSQAMIRGMQDEDNDQFVAYFLPTDDTLEKRDNDKRLGVDYEDDVTYDYKLTKEYNWNVKNKASKGYEENFFFCYRPGEGVFYNELETRIRLSKRVKGREQKTQHSNTILAVKHRQMDDHEVSAQSMRKQALEHVQNDSDDSEAESSSDESSTAGSDAPEAGQSVRQKSDNEDSDSETEKRKDSDSDSGGAEEQKKEQSDSSSDDEAPAEKKNIFGSDSENDSDSDSD